MIFAYFLLIIIPLVIGFFIGKSIYRKKYKQENSNILNCLFIPKSGLNLVAYTVATHKSPELERLINSFKKSKIPLVILGYGCKWQGFGNKLLWFKEHLEKYGDNNHIALFVDAYDVVCLGSEQEIIKKFISFKKPIVFSGEKGCHPDPSLAKYFNHINSPFRYPNSGTYMGYSKNILNMLQKISIKPHEDDQLFATKYIIKNPLLYAIDKKCQIFLTLYNVDKSELSLERKIRIVVERFKTKPCVIHGNGPSKSMLNKLI
jgi:procollagen-lysine,2-oxoglutarate 5-dioxygenase